jgi:hypothetical protein
MKINFSDISKISTNNKNITIKNNKVYINDELVEDFSKYEDKEITLVVQGDVKNVEISGNITCNGINGDIDCSGNIDCNDIMGDIDCSGNIVCNEINGDIDCTGNIKINK